jgi:dephospho-CoA kinase
MYLFGITGTKFSGKSTAAKLIRRMNIPVIHWDLMYTNMLEPGTFVHEELMKILDNTIINIDGSINIYKLGILMHEESWVKTYFNDLMLTCSKDAMERMINAFEYNSVDFVGIDSIMFLEKNLIEYLDSLILIKTSNDIIRQRMSSGLDEKFINICLNSNDEVYLGDYEINNDFDIINLNKQCEHIMREIKKEHAKKI